MFENFDWIGAMRSSPVMIVILGCSVVTLGFALERAIYFWKRRGTPESTLALLLSSVREGDMKGAAWTCNRTPHPMGPVVGQVIEATPAEPYLCMRLDLDPGQLSALMMELGQGATWNQRAERLKLGLSISPVDPALLDAAVRLARLLETPKDIPVLAPLVEREILYRLLSCEYGDRLRQIATADHRLVAVNRAISWLKRNYAAPFRIETVAREARLSPSALHHSFKSVTAMSPLQYQKQLRLQEARRLMLGQAMDAATAGHSVGYESPSQFSREYSRLFGAPPSRDIARLKESVRAAAAD